MSTVNTYLPGRTQYLYVSPDNWTTTYTLVCVNKLGLKSSRAVNKQESQCGVAKEFGADDNTLDVEAINNLTPDAVVAGVGEASYKLVRSWFVAVTELKWRRKTPTDGSQLFQEGVAKIANIDDENSVGENMTFSFTLEIIGAIDETA
jgi:hypothetical protein